MRALHLLRKGRIVLKLALSFILRSMWTAPTWDWSPEKRFLKQDFTNTNLAEKMVLLLDGMSQCIRTTPLSEPVKGKHWRLVSVTIRG